MNVVVVGHVCIDRNISENRSYTAPGGPAVFIGNVFKQLPNIYLEVIVPGKDLKKKETLIYENRSKGDRRSQKTFNLKYAKPVSITNKLKGIVANSDLIFFAPLTPDYRPDYIASLLGKTKKDSVKIISPQGYFRDFDKNNNVVQRDFIEADEILPLFDVVIASVEDHKNIKHMAKVWSKKIKVIVTLGDKGSQYFYRGRSIFAKSNPVQKEEIVDSVGSGDIFTAAFGYKYFLKRDLKESLRFANDVARQCLFFDGDHADFYFGPER